MNYFTDENLSEYLARMIGHFDRANEIIPHIDRFPKGTPDEEWIAALSTWEPPPVVILGDGRILRNPKLKEVARQSGLSFVVMGESFMRTSWNDQAWKFVKVWPDIVKHTKSLRRPTVFDIKISSLRIQQRSMTRNLR